MAQDSHGGGMSGGLLYAAGALPRPGELKLQPKQVCGLMRKHGVTIRSVATQHGLTMKRVREVRDRGVAGFLAEEWVQIITGKWPDEVKA